MKRSTLDTILGKRRDGQAFVLATDLQTGEEWTLPPDDAAAHPSAWLGEAALACLQADRSKLYEEDGRSVFFHVFNTPVRVVIVGAVHIAQPLSAMVREVGFDVVIVDPREAFATESRFPDLPLRVEWPAAALEAIGIDHRTAIVTVTHDPKLDDPALQAALASTAFYIGALGSRRTHGKRLARLKEAGFSEADCERIHAPVGLDIGARTPGEIAASVLAEIVGVLRRPAQ